MITIIVVDDHVMFRQGLVTLLSGTDDISIIAECSSGTEALDLIREREPRIAVLDVSMPGMDGITLVKKLKSEQLATEAIILTMHDDPYFRDRALEAGACAYVLKDKAFDELLNVIRAVTSREAIAGSQKHDLRISGEIKGALLTERETQVLGMIAVGCTNRIIAAELNISIKTVESHRTHLMNKLDRHSTAELVRYAIKVGLA